MRRYALLLLSTAVVFPCFAQNAPIAQNALRRIYSISGKLNDDADQRPLTNVQLSLVSDGSVQNTVYSDDNGNFEFDRVWPGEYMITVKLDGYDDYTSDTISITNAPLVSFNLGLTKSLAAKNTSGPTVSARRLAIPGKARESFDKGLDMLSAKGNYSGAIAQFQRAIKDFPAYYEAYTMEGVAYLSLADADAAEIALRKSIDLSSSHYPDAYFFLAGLLNNAKRFPEAEAAAQSAIALEASSWAAHYELARSLYALKHLDDAEPHAVRAHELNPNNPKIVLLLADIHLRRNNYSAVLHDIDDYLKLEPTGAQADQVRKDRDQVLQTMQSTSPQIPSDHFE